jgi:hypothetical protein
MYFLEPLIFVVARIESGKPATALCRPHATRNEPARWTFSYEMARAAFKQPSI